MIKKNFGVIGFITWTLAGATVHPVSFRVTMYIVKFLSLGAREDRIAGLFMIPITIGGILISQWLILRNYLKNISSWIRNTLKAWGIIVGGSFIIFTWLSRRPPISDPALTKVLTIMYFTAFGTIIGWFQALALRGCKRGYLLIPANVVGIYLVLMAVGKSINNSFEMALVGGIPAITTGTALFHILRKAEQANDKRAGE